VTLAADRLTLRRGGRTVLDGVSFDLAPAEIVAVIGPNGAGKSSLLEGLLGLLPLAGGRVTWSGAPIAGFAARARLFSYLPDAAEPPPEVPVATLLAHARRFGRAPAALAGDLFDRLAVAPLAAARAGDLSRGEKRRVALFGALCTDRPVIVLDEPLGAFDPLQLLGVLDLLRDRARAGAALLVTVHQLADAEKFADRVLLLDAGRARAFGPLADLRARAGLPAEAPLEQVFLSILREKSNASA
jgi:ABC-type multidrug transport system ATPase subunit